MEKKSERGKMIEVEDRLAALEDEVNNNAAGTRMTLRKIVEHHGSLITRVDGILRGERGRIDRLEMENENRISEIHAAESMVLDHEETPGFTGAELKKYTGELRHWSLVAWDRKIENEKLKRELKVTNQNLDTYIERFNEQQRIVERRDKEIQKLLGERNEFWRNWKSAENQLSELLKIDAHPSPHLRQDGKGGWKEVKDSPYYPKEQD